MAADTFLAIAGEPDVKEKALEGHAAAGKTFKTASTSAALSDRQGEEAPRQLFIYFSDKTRVVLALRYGAGRFMEQRCKGTLQVWGEPFFTHLRLPKIFNLRTNPTSAPNMASNSYWDWFLHSDYIIFAAQFIASNWPDV